MADRITMDDLRGMVQAINTRTGSSQEPWSKGTDGKSHANIGCYHLSGAYGGWKLHRINNKHGGVTEPLHTGYTSKRELWDAMRYFLDGMEAETAHYALTGD